MASAASVKTLVSLEAFKCAPLLRVSGDAPTRSSCLPAPALPGSGSAGRLRTFRSFCPLSLAAPRLFVPLVYLNPALSATPLFPQKPEHRRRVRDAPVPDHRKGLPERHLHHPDNLRRLRRGPPPVLHRQAPEDVPHLRAPPGARVHARQPLEPLCPVPGLLQKLPPRRLPGVLPGLDPAARQLEREPADRLPPLTHEDHVVALGHGDHGREPLALQHAVLDNLPARQL